jgi:hypothetical protein
MRGNVRTWSNLVSAFIWLFLGVGLIVACQIGAAMYMIVAEALRTGVKPDEAEVQRLIQDGDLIGIAFPVAMVLVVGLIALVVRYRRKRPIAEYLALRPQPVGVLLRWLGYAALLLLAANVSGALFQRPDVPEWMATTVSTVDHPYVFVFALAVCGPVLEEVLFRGYILRASLESRLHPLAAIVLVSALWALTHLQYDLYDMFWIFLLGILLAWSRLRTGSLYPAVAVHCTWNLVAYLGAVYAVQ